MIFGINGTCEARPNDQMTLGVSSELGAGRTDTSQLSGDIINYQHESGAERNFPVSGNPSKEVNSHFAERGDTGTNMPQILVTQF